MDAAVRVRRASGADVPRLLPLCAEHAAFERLPCLSDHAAAGLAAALDRVPAPLHAWLAECSGRTVGYATASLDFSTLATARYLHVDCLFVRDGWRNRAIGRRLWQALHAFALACGCRQMQWQTPEWNLDAARFYLKLGASESRKRRYVLSLDATMMTPMPTTAERTMLELRPTCEHCNKPLPPASTEARICSFECTFCRDCVEQALDGVCPNCGGGFVPRPVRPARDWKNGNFLGRHPATAKVTHQPVDAATHRALVARVGSVPPHER